MNHEGLILAKLFHTTIANSVALDYLWFDIPVVTDSTQIGSVSQNLPHIDLQLVTVKRQLWYFNVCSFSILAHFYSCQIRKRLCKHLLIRLQLFSDPLERTNATTLYVWTPHLWRISFSIAGGYILFSLYPRPVLCNSRTKVHSNR